MTIAGSDSGGGAGLQADLKTFAALGVFGTSVVTAVTAQNTAKVLGVEVMPPDVVDLQIDAVLSDLAVRAVKTGMLADAGTVASVGRRAAAGHLPNLVVDPVLVSSTGTSLLGEAGVRAYREMLVPHASVLTPNLYETAVLLGRRVADIGGIDEMLDAGSALVELGAGAVVVKGGHLSSRRSPDVVVTSSGGASEVSVLDCDRVRSSNVHGSGCSLSAAIAAHLALGLGIAESVRLAKSFVTAAIRGAAGWRLGEGHGPLDHFGWGSTNGDAAMPDQFEKGGGFDRGGDELESRRPRPPQRPTLDEPNLSRGNP
jgi:hydroxymethylpyrimidine/phosphomethylpyrimidine kinase